MSINLSPVPVVPGPKVRKLTDFASTDGLYNVGGEWSRILSDSPSVGELEGTGDWESH